MPVYPDCVRKPDRTAELPFFLDLLDHLAARGCPVPRTIHDTRAPAIAAIETPEGRKALALIEFLPGVSVSRAQPAQARAVGGALAQMHLASQGLPITRSNSMGPDSWHQLLIRLHASGLDSIDPALGADRRRRIARAGPGLAAGSAARRHPCRPVSGQCADAGRHCHRTDRFLLRLHRHYRITTLP